MIRQVSPNTDQRRRSLLQKAVRRGYASLARQVALSLEELGDKTWLRQRIPVIVFEECWPLGSLLDFPMKLPDGIACLDKVARATKAKDAAGLGSLAYAYSEGDTSIQAEIGIDQQILRIITRAIEDPEKFWDWVEPQCTEENQILIVNAARQAHRKGGWPWDRAFMLAAAYLAVTSPIAEISISPNEPTEEFPFWIALDKHTAEGKRALRQVAQEFNVPANQLLWASFYCESALTNECIDSPWWSAERRWRLGKAGLTVERARVLWEKVQPYIKEVLAEQAERLRTLYIDIVNDPATPWDEEEPPTIRQLPMF